MLLIMKGRIQSGHEVEPRDRVVLDTNRERFMCLKAIGHEWSGIEEVKQIVHSPTSICAPSCMGLHMAMGS